MSVWIISPTPAAAHGIQKSSFYHNFGHPTSTKQRNGCSRVASAGENLHFATVLEVTSTKWRKGCVATWKKLRFDERVISRCSLPNLPGPKKNRFLKAAFSKSSLSQRLFSEAILSSPSQQLLSAAILSYPLAVVRVGMRIILLRTRVGGQQPCASNCWGQGLVVSHAHHLAEVRGCSHLAELKGWWSAIITFI